MFQIRGLVLDLKLCEDGPKILEIQKVEVSKFSGYGTCYGTDLHKKTKEMAKERGIDKKNLYSDTVELLIQNKAILAWLYSVIEEKSALPRQTLVSNGFQVSAVKRVKSRITNFFGDGVDDIVIKLPRATKGEGVMVLRGYDKKINGVLKRFFSSANDKYEKGDSPTSKKAESFTFNRVPVAVVQERLIGKLIDSDGKYNDEGGYDPTLRLVLNLKATKGENIEFFPVGAYWKIPQHEFSEELSPEKTVISKVSSSTQKGSAPFDHKLLEALTEQLAPTLTELFNVARQHGLKEFIELMLKSRATEVKMLGVHIAGKKDTFEHLSEQDVKSLKPLIKRSLDAIKLDGLEISKKLKKKFHRFDIEVDQVIARSR